MKKFIALVVIFTAFCSLSTISGVYGQCDRKTGIAIVRSENGKPETPKAAMKFPQYQGGTRAMCKYMCENMRYPEALKRQNAKGTSTVSFTVNSDGTISNAELVKSSGRDEFDQEALRLVRSFPKWKPAEQDCSPISMKSQIDVEFDCEKCGCGRHN